MRCLFKVLKVKGGITSKNLQKLPSRHKNMNFIIIQYLFITYITYKTSYIGPYIRGEYI